MRIVIDGIIVETEVLSDFPSNIARAIAKDGRFVTVQFYERKPRYQAEIDAARQLVRQIQAGLEEDP